MTRSLLPRKAAAGFSLVEVTMAIGIVAFALTAIMGLLSVTLRNSKSAVDDTMVAEMSNDLVSYLRKQSFDKIPSLTNVFFDYAGKRLNTINTSGEIVGLSTTDAVAQGAIYECVPAIVGDTNTVSASGATNLWRVTMKFQWPAGVSNTVNTKSIHADIARY